MELTFACPGCGATGRVPAVERENRATCPRCGWAKDLRVEGFEQGTLHACPWCATTDLYVQKDFPQGLGLAIVFVGFAISTVFWYYEMPISAYLVLLGSIGLDLVMYHLVRDVTICYRCLSQIRGDGSNSGGRFQPFDLAVGERYRQERLRAQELREREARAE